MEPFEIFFSKILKTNQDRNRDLIKKAYNLGKQSHSLQLRKFTGEPYFTHPINVALLLKDFDNEVVCAGLLHDVLEDCADKCDEDRMKAEVGETITRLVKGVTKTSKEPDAVFSALEEVAKVDERVIYVKLADRLDNMARDDMFQLKQETKERYVEETRRLLEFSEEFGITFLHEEIEERVKVLEAHLFKTLL